MVKLSVEIFIFLSPAIVEIKYFITSIKIKLKEQALNRIKNE